MYRLAYLPNKLKLQKYLPPNSNVHARDKTMNALEKDGRYVYFI